MTTKVWLITGSSRGLGLSLAKAALAAGEKVVATARDPRQLDRLSAIGESANLMKVALDVTDPVAAKAAIGAAVEAYGRLDVLVNNAGYANVSAIEDAPDDDFRTQFETNFFGVVNVTKAALPQLRKQRSGHVIQISSIGGRSGSPGLASYQSAKFAVEGFSEVLAQETKPLGLKVTIVEPGGIRTDWAGASMRVDPVSPDYEPTVGAFSKHVRQNHDTTRGDPDRAAQAILKVAAVADPPLRLLLGTDAMFVAKLVAGKRDAEDAKWAALSATSDVEGLGDFADTPVAKMLLSMRG